jgi:hypothetical protein
MQGPAADAREPLVGSGAAGALHAGTVYRPRLRPAAVLFTCPCARSPIPVVGSIVNKVFDELIPFPSPQLTPSPHSPTCLSLSLSGRARPPLESHLQGRPPQHRQQRQPALVLFQARRRRPVLRRRHFPQRRRRRRLLLASLARRLRSSGPAWARGCCWSGPVVRKSVQPVLLFARRYCLWQYLGLVSNWDHIIKG